MSIFIRNSTNGIIIWNSNGYTDKWHFFLIGHKTTYRALPIWSYSCRFIGFNTDKFILYAEMKRMVANDFGHHFLPFMEGTPSISNCFAIPNRE